MPKNTDPKGSQFYEGYSANRPQYYSNQLLDCLFTSGACKTIGRDAVLLVARVVQQEDAVRYRGPVGFWNSQLRDDLGFTSNDQLDKARKSAEQEGWLAYYRLHNRAEGQYYAKVPPKLRNILPASGKKQGVNLPDTLPGILPPSGKNQGVNLPDNLPASGKPPSLNPKNLPPPPSPVAPAPCPVDGGGGDLDDPWKRVTADVAKAGLVDASSAVRRARENGLSPEGVREVLEFWQVHPGRWEQGALHYRLSNALPDTPADQGWPPPINTSKRKQSDKRRDELRADVIVMQGRKEKLPDVEIAKLLRKEGLSWPGENPKQAEGKAG